MAKGEESLWLELARRHATTDEERVAVAPPPGTASSAPILAAGAIAGVLTGVVALRRRGWSRR